MFTTKGNYRSFSCNIKNLIKQGQNDTIKSLVKGMAPSDLVDSSKTSLLHLSARYNNHDLTKHLIKIKCNVNAKSAFNQTPLMVAASNNSFKAAQILIEANADVYATNSSNKSALQLLLSNKKVPLYLINCCLKKVKSDDPSAEAIAEKLFIANCPLHVAIYLGNPRVTSQIINRYGLIDPGLFCAAIDLAFKLRDKENVLVLLQCGAEIDISTGYAIPFLSIMCVSKRDGSNLELISAFLEKVTDWYSLGEESLSKLDLIFKIGTKQQIELFLQYNVNDYVKNKFPGHDLLINLFGNNGHVKKLLKQLQFDVNSHGENGFTALHFAAGICDLASAKTLLELGANPNIQDFEGRVPLTILDDWLYSDDYDYSSDDSFTDKKSDSLKIQMVEILLQGGADPQLDMNANNFDWFEDFEARKLQLMLAQLAINESKGMLIEERIRLEINFSLNPKNIYETCSQQLERLKDVKVHGSITLYTILVSDAAKIADSIRDREALEAIFSDTENIHFYYMSKLKNSVNRILHTMDLREKASTFICEITGLPYSQYIILEKILSFLTYKDLLVFE